MTTTFPPGYGTEQAVNVPFGSGPDESVPHSWAARMLTDLRKENPRLFGKLLSAAAMNEKS